jgi:hypothetical protein
MGIEQRMAEAIARLTVRLKTRTPKAFYLNRDDWLDFLRTDPVMENLPFARGTMLQHTFNGVPVRLTLQQESRLYDNASAGRALPKHDKRWAMTPERKVQMDQMRAAPRVDYLHGPELVASLGDGGLWSWKSSPHVLWLAWALENPSCVPVPTVAED